MKLRRIYRFGSFRLDATVKVLSRDGEPVHAPRKAVETLVALAEGNGQVVTKEELIARLWPDRVVNEANLAQNIAVVRRVMRAEPGAPGYIETFSGAGYRLLGPVTVSDEPIEIPEATPPPADIPDRSMEPRGAASSRGRPFWRSGRLTIATAAVAISLLSLWLLRQRNSAPTELRWSPVTRLTGKEYQPAVSPDARNVAFVWDRNNSGKGGVWIQGEGSRSPRRVSPDDDATYASPAWSPDGRQLAYLRFRQARGEIVVSSLEDGATRTVAAVFPSRYGLNYRHLDWSPDGALLAADDADSPLQPLSVYLISLRNGQRRRLTTPEAVIVGDVDPRFSPDGTTVSFIRVFHRANQELFTVPVQGGQALAVSSDGHRVSGQDWMPDSTTVVFGSDRGGEFRLWKIRTTGARRKPETTGVYGDFPLQISLSRRAEALVYSVLQQDLNIWRLDLLAPRDSAGRWTSLIASSGQDASPQYSPQGDKICFRSDRSGDEQLWVSNSDGGNPVQITQGTLRPSVGRWSPDGRSIIFNNPGTTEMYIARLAATGDWMVRPTGMHGVHPVFSPDGQWIYAGTLNSIVRIPAAGGPSGEIAAVMGISLGVSNDGRYVYFVREPSGTTLWRLKAGSQSPEKVLDGLVPYCSSCWALSPTGIYFLGNKVGALDRQALYFHEFASGKDKELVDYPEALSPIGIGPFSLSPDGRYLLCVRVDPSNSDIFRVEPFR
jgi:Tol biopolymer transport system component/DNA-binding winged helix-turn-helix (wHTH) protein